MAKVTSKLQVTVPKAVADRLGIRPGDSLDWQVEGTAARVTRAATAGKGSAANRLARFDEATKRIEERARAWRRAHGAKEPTDRGWTRESLYTRGRAR